MRNIHVLIYKKRFILLIRKYFRDFYYNDMQRLKNAELTNKKTII